MPWNPKDWSLWVWFALGGALGWTFIELLTRALTQ